MSKTKCRRCNDPIEVVYPCGDLHYCDQCSLYLAEMGRLADCWLNAKTEAERRQILYTQYRLDRKYKR